MKDLWRRLPVNEPLDALVSRFQEEVRTQTGEEERDAGVQLLVDLLGLDAPLQGQRGPTEQGALELQEGWFDSQQLLQPRAAWRGEDRRRGCKGMKHFKHLVVVTDRAGTHRGRRRCFCPWWRHLWGRRAARRPLCASAGWGRSEAARASSAGGPRTS